MTFIKNITLYLVLMIFLVGTVYPTVLLASNPISAKHLDFDKTTSNPKSESKQQKEVTEEEDENKEKFIENKPDSFIATTLRIHFFQVNFKAQMTPLDKDCYPPELMITKV
jgi:hypothetical protein